VYSRELNGQVLEFGVSGKLIMNVLVMYDRQTDSLWSQLLGKAVEGELAGQQLEFLPSWQTTWEDWKTRHPDTLALVKGYQGDRDPYDTYYESYAAGVIGEEHQDNRLGTKDFIVGVALGEDARAYPFRLLNDEPVVNDILNGIPILVVFDPGTASGVVFLRTVDGQTLTFNSSGELQLKDEETNSTWDALNGEAIAGELKGASLERVKSTSSFWFGWKDFYPETGIYGQSE
jgi:hypothetical protein